MAAAIEVRSISKQFKLYHEHYTSLKERVVNYGRIPYEPFMALQDIDFDVEADSPVSMPPPPGRGKSALLKRRPPLLQTPRGETRPRCRGPAVLAHDWCSTHQLTAL